MTLRVATRRSPLALVQAHLVQRRLAEHGLESELVLVETRGDRDVTTDLVVTSRFTARRTCRAWLPRGSRWPACPSDSIRVTF
jgi:hypothetical protein